MCLNLQLNWEMNVSSDVLAPVAETIEAECNRGRWGNGLRYLRDDLALPTPHPKHCAAHLT